MEAGLFDYSISKSDTDTLDLMGNGVAQCADDAGMLTSLLRSVGIPAHPVTADAGAETGSIGWGFDTWTEFLVPGTGGPEWNVVHSHWQTSGHVEGPMSRNPFGHNIGVAQKSVNDIIIMAGPNWVWTDLNGSNPAVTYGRQACGEPNQQLNAKAWVEELCEAGYWNSDTHWSCPAGAAGTRSMSLTLSPTSRADYRLRRVNGSASISNDTARALPGRLQWRLVVDIPETKVFPDRVIGRSELRVSVPPYTARNVSFQFPLGDQLQPGETLYLQLVAGDQVLSAVEVPSQADIVVEGDRAMDLRLDAADTLVVTLRNRTHVPIRGIRVQVKGPRQVQLPREIQGVRTALKPDEAMTLRVPIVGVAPLDVGELDVLVRSQDGGSVKHRIPLRVQPNAPAQPPGALVR